MSTETLEKPLSPWWRHAVILVMVFGFSLLTIVTVQTYTNAPLPAGTLSGVIATTVSVD